MNTQRILSSLALTLCLCIGQSQTKNDLLKQVDDLVGPYEATNNFSGTILISRSDSILVNRSYGKMHHSYNLEHKPESKFFLASVSMIFTSAAIMKLYEDGMLNLDDTLDQYFPWYKHGSKITIHQMLAQRSGIPRIGAENNVDYDSVTKFTHTPETLIAYFKDYVLLFEPGTKYSHGRSEYILLAHLIEQLSGKPFGKFLKHEIFDPLDMHDTGHYSGEKEIIKDLSWGYAPKGFFDVESAYQIDWSSKTGHASIYSTVSDLQKFAQAIMDHRLLKPESWKIILTDYGSNVGYGWFIRDHLERKRVQMNGRSPGFSSYLAIYPDEELTVAVLSNTYISSPAEIGMSLAAMVLNEPYKKLKLSRDTIDPEIATKLVGKYRFGENFYVPNYTLAVVEKDGRLSCEWGPFVPIDDAKGKNLNYIIRVYWSSIEFVENTDGFIKEMLFDGHQGQKIE